MRPPRTIIARNRMSYSLRLDENEKRSLDALGFVVRTDVFDTAEIAAIGAACDALVARLLDEKRHTKHTLGSYVFELQRQLGTAVKWEQDNPDVVLGIEPFAHLSAALERWALDPRFLEPAKDVVGAEEIALFTEKLNLKSAHKGGPIVLHQDFPYWEGISEVAARVATAVLFLDDATRENGCLEVAPGSHRDGVQTRRQVGGFADNEMEPSRFDLARLSPLEVRAGAVVFFGPFLVHRSLPNRTGGDRRALLYSYQPAGHKHLRELVNFTPRETAS
jgi:Phytanoyl-CoA dioxygenase (PhyH)